MIKKKTNNLNSGLIYMPYTMLETVETISESNFTPKDLISSRYSTKMVNNSYYGIFKSKSRIRMNKINNIFDIAIQLPLFIIF